MINQNKTLTPAPLNLPSREIPSGSPTGTPAALPSGREMEAQSQQTQTETETRQKRRGTN